MSPTEAVALAEAQEEARRRTLQVFRLRKQREQLREDAKRLAAELRDMLPAYHQTGSLRDHADPTDRTGWHIKGVETCEDVGCMDALAALAAHDDLVQQEWSPFGKPDA